MWPPQIGGKYVTVYSVESNPNTDPHTYEVSPGVASEVAAAELVIQNGVGYDDFMTKVESASPNAGRKVINVQHLLGLARRHPEPPSLVRPEDDAGRGRGSGRRTCRLSTRRTLPTFQATRRFVASLNPWLDAIASFKAKYAGTTAATTEPVADYLLTAMGIDNLTPFGFQADIMNGTDPTPRTSSSRTASSPSTRSRCSVTTSRWSTP